MPLSNTTPPAINTGTTEAPVRVFRSRAFPDKPNHVLLIAHLMLEPVAYGLLFVMLVSLGVVLQGFSPIWYTLIGSLLTYLVARSWAVSRAERQTVEIRIRGELAMRLSLLDASKNVSSTSWEWVSGIQLHPESLSLSLGHAVIDLEKADWPDWRELVITLSGAAKLGSQPTPL